MYTLRVKLKQHTPLIHFQHDQYGATLRASEVKPKLDKFIIKTLTVEQIEDGKIQGWIQEKEGRVSLVYKMKLHTLVQDIEYYDTNQIRPYYNYEKDKRKGIVQRCVKYGTILDKEPKTKYYIKESNGERYIAKCRAEDHKVLYDLNPYPCYFGNMNADILNDDEYKKRAYCYHTIDMTISTQYDSLYKRMNEINYSDFFMQTNFGTRQSKGFGSFYVDQTDPYYKRPNSLDHFSHFRIDIPADVDEDDYLFQRIELFYKTLRGGINLKDKSKNTIFYFKSCAFLYCKDKLKAQWDKKSIKSNLFKYAKNPRIDSLSSQLSKYSKHQKEPNFEPLFWESCAKLHREYDIRDLLGLSTSEQWLSYQAQIEKEVVASKTDVGAIDRMQSPLLFKPINCGKDTKGNPQYDVFIIDNSQEVGLDSIKGCDISISNGRGKSFNLPLPVDFSVASFLEFVFTKINLDEYVSEEYQEHEYFAILKNIYEQIKKNMIKR